MASSWPERILTDGPHRATPLIEYEIRGYGEPTSSFGFTNTNYNQIGSSKLVYCVNKRRYRKPSGWSHFTSYQKWKYWISRKAQWRAIMAGLPALSRFQARTITQTCDDEVFSLDYPYPGPRIILKGKLAANTMGPVMDQSGLGFPAWDGNLADSSILGAYGNICGSEAEVGTMLGELRETLSYLRKPWSSAVKEFRQFMKGRGVLSRSRSGLKMAANEWMAFRYGIRPLVSDIQKLTALSCHLMDGGFHRSSGSALGSPSVTSMDSYENLLGISFVWRNVQTTQTKAFTKVYWKYNPTATDLSTLLDSLQLNIWDVPAIAWELVPLSFVVDWFFDVGNWLKAVRPRPGSDVLGSCTTIKSVVHTERYCVSARSPYSAYPCKSLARSRAHSTLEIVDRNINLPFPRLPTFNKTVLGIAREVDALILIGQRMPKLR